MRAPDEASEASATRSSRRALAGAALLAAIALLAAALDVRVSGHWHGIFLLLAKEGPRLELKDDLFLGDGQRLVTGVSFSRLRRALSGAAVPSPGEPSLEVEWDEHAGSGVVRNHLGDGTEIVTLFARYEDSAGKTTHGLFVGGALPDVAADAALANQSGMAYRDARGWHHIWCNVNEGLYDVAEERLSYPSEWRLLGTRVLIRDRERVVIESSHELAVAGGVLRVDRFAYFRAGRPWFKLGIRILNAAETPIDYVYGYGDEPWVGEFGSAAGNVGWLQGEIVRVEGAVDVARHRWAGVLDEDSGLANFVSWVGGERPDVVYFANQPGLRQHPTAVPLASNEVFVGLEWRTRLLPGESRSMLLALGLAAVDAATGIPFLPEGAGPR